MKFRSKPKIIDAEQFLDETNLPRGVNRGNVRSENAGQFYVTTIQGRNVPVKIGEWIVDEGDGIHFYPIDDVTFRGPKGYEPLG